MKAREKGPVKADGAQKKTKPRPDDKPNKAQLSLETREKRKTGTRDNAITGGFEGKTRKNDISGKNGNCNLGEISGVVNNLRNDSGDQNRRTGKITVRLITTTAIKHYCSQRMHKKGGGLCPSSTPEAVRTPGF